MGITPFNESAYKIINKINNTNMKDITLFLTEQLNLNVNESNESIKDEKSFREYAEAKLKEIHGDDYDEAKAKEMIDGILSDNKELVEKEDWGALVGILNKGAVK